MSKEAVKLKHALSVGNAIWGGQDGVTELLPGPALGIVGNMCHHLNSRPRICFDYFYDAEAGKYQQVSQPEYILAFKVDDNYEFYGCHIPYDELISRNAVCVLYKLIKKTRSTTLIKATVATSACENILAVAFEYSQDHDGERIYELNNKFTKLLKDSVESSINIILLGIVKESVSKNTPAFALKTDSLSNNES